MLRISSHIGFYSPRVALGLQSVECNRQSPLTYDPSTVEGGFALSPHLVHSSIFDNRTEDKKYSYATLGNLISGLMLFAQGDPSNALDWNGRLLDSFWSAMENPYYWLICIAVGVIRVGYCLWKNHRGKIDNANFLQQGVDPMEHLIAEGRTLSRSESTLTTQTSTILDLTPPFEGCNSPTTDDGLLADSKGASPSLLGTLAFGSEKEGSRVFVQLSPDEQNQIVERRPVDRLHRSVGVGTITDLSSKTHDLMCPQCKVLNTADQKLCVECAFPVGMIGGKYRMVGEISTEGGQGVIYSAIHTGLMKNEDRAIKVIKIAQLRSDPQRAERARVIEERFYNEVNAINALSQEDEHIVRVYDDFGEESWLGLYYVMEYLKGKNLDKFIRENGAMEPHSALHIFSQICMAVRSAHKGNIVHRDLKPANIILIKRGDEENYVKVIDFGIVKDLSNSDESRRTRGCIGTPQYMAPEQWQGRSNPQTDIYALGIIFYELLTGGKPPIEVDPDPMKMAISHASGNRKPMSAHEGFGYLHPLDNIVLRALRSKDAERYHRVEDFLKAVERGIKKIR